MKRISILALLLAAFAHSTPARAADSGTAPPRRQLLIEMVVLETSDSARILKLAGDEGPLSSPAGLKGFSYDRRLGQGLETAVSQLNRNPGVKILQRPRIQTAENVPAKLFVGQVPVHSPEPVGISVEVNPTLQTNGMIDLDLHFKSSSITGNRQPLMVTTRQGDAKIQLRDHETAVLAGLNSGAQSTARTVVLRFPKELPGYLPAAPDSRELVLLIRPTLLR